MPTRSPEPLDLTTLTSTLPTEARIVVLRWPEQDDVRQQLAAMGVPRILVIDAETDPPEVVDELEDWVREPLGPADLQARKRTMGHRLPDHPAPHIDEDGILRVGRRWVVIPDQQLPVVELLLGHANQVVSTEELAAAYRAGGGSDSTASIRALVSRLGQRMRDVGLRLHAVPRRGLILEVPIGDGGRLAPASRGNDHTTR